MPAAYATRRVAARGGGALHLHYPAERTDYTDWFARFAAADTPPLTPTLRLEAAILGAGRDWACLYDPAGRRVDAAALLRYDEDFAPQMWRAAPTLPRLKASAGIDPPAVYQSILFNHWGHFLLESIARLGPKLEDPELALLPSLYAWSPPERLPAIDTFLAALDQPPLSYDAEAPRIRLGEVFVPPAAFVHEGFADPRHLIAPHRVARRLLGRPAQDERPVYLSRSGLAAPVAGRIDVRNEAELEDRLTARGVRVAHMERLDLGQQMTVMNAHRVFIGLWGSALHNTLFSLDGPGISTFVLLDGARRPANFLLVDQIVGNAAHYLNVVHDDHAGGLRIDVGAAMAYFDEAGGF